MVDGANLIVTNIFMVRPRIRSYNSRPSGWWLGGERIEGGNEGRGAGR